MELTQFEVGWLTGLLEGEGHFRYTTKTQRITLNSTDEDVIYRAAALFDRVTGKACNITVKDMGKYNPNAKEQYYIQLYGESARLIMRLVLPHLCYRRRQRVWQCLNCYEAPTKKRMNPRPALPWASDNVVPIKRRV